MSDYSGWELTIRRRDKALPDNDAIWGTPASVYSSHPDYWVVDSARGGEYVCPARFHEVARSRPVIERAKLSTWISEQNRAGVWLPYVDTGVLDVMPSRKPMRFAVKVDRFFEYLVQRGYRVGEAVFPWEPAMTGAGQKLREEVARWIEALDDREVSGFIKVLESDGLIEAGSNIHRLTARGMMRLDALDQQGANRDQAFVAMWFGSEMDEAYLEGIAPALEDAGYRPFRIDQTESLNKIDDEIIAEIRRSSFVVADFTSGVVPDGAGAATVVPRGGVYYEAGFAQGLGLPVIWTVRADQINAVHFDTRQFNHIVWSDVADLRKRLTRRILAVIGERGDGRVVIRG